MVLSLVRLRYKLIWAQARTNSGKIALFIGLYILGASLFLLLALGGTRAAVAGVQLGRGEQIARWLLTGLFIDGIVLSTILGVGPRSAFSDEVLRRYPLTSAGRFLARHLTGVLEPVWPILLATGLGLAIGFVSLGAGSLLIGSLTVLVFTVVTYLCAVILLSIVDQALKHRIGAPIVGVLFFGLVAIAPTLFVSSTSSSRSVLDEVLRLTPPGVAATLIAGPTLRTGLLSAAVLTGWCLIFAISLAALERRPAVAPAVTSVPGSWRDIYDQLANVFNESYGPLVAKSLRYHLRSNRVRVGLFTTVVAIAAISNLRDKSSSFEQDQFLPIVYFFIVGISSTAVIALNHFGYDDAGIRRYAILPVPFVTALRASSIVSLSLGGLATLSAFVVLIVSSPIHVTPYIVLIFLCSGIAGLFMFNTLGLLTTILSPRRVDPRSLLSNPLSTGANAVMIGGLIVTFVVVDRLIAYIDLTSAGRGWWIFPSLAIVGVVFYAIVFRLIDRLLITHREALINSLAGASTN
jgi:hypothetical protein